MLNNSEQNREGRESRQKSDSDDMNIVTNVLESILTKLYEILLHTKELLRKLVLTCCP